MLRDRRDAFGEASFETISSVVQVEESGWAAERVNAAMERLNAASEQRPFRAVVLWLRSANAFTMPGRYLYVGRELLSRGLSEEGVAFVLAHEMAHHALGHLASFERVLESEGEPALAKMRAWFEHVAERVLRYSPDQEREADAWALRLCAAAGYDERGALELFDLLRRVALDYRALDSVFGDDAEPGAIDAWLARVTGYAPSHPAILHRREAILRLVGEGDVEDAKPAAAPEGFTSTTMVCACAACSIRFAPMTRCPRCGGDGVVDLRDPRRRLELLRALYRKASPRERTGRKGLGAMAGGASGGFLTYLLVTGSGIGDAVAGGLLAGLGAAALYAFVRPLGRLLHEFTLLDGAAHQLNRAARLAPYAVTLGGAGQWVDGVGTVRALRPVTAPVSGRRCAAYRIAGKGPSGVIDDADVGQIEIVGRFGCVRVDGDALLKLEVEREPEPASVGPALEAFLRARGAFPTGAEVRLAEAVLLDGDRVSVQGAGEARVVARGMRAEEEVLVLAWPQIEGIADEGAA